MDNPSSSMLGLITASLYMGGFAGSLFAALPADRFGRRVVLQAGQFLELVGSILQAAALGRGMFIAGRVIVGIGMSFSTVAGPSLLAELLPPRLRGKIAPSYNALWYVGSIIASWLTFGTGHLNTHWSWRIPSIVQSILPFLIMIGVSFMPESPRWLCSQGRHDEARALFVKYHANGNPADALVAVEMDEVAAALAQDTQETTSWASLIKTKANRRRVFICIVIPVATLWNGQGVITYYFTQILDSVGITSTNAQTGINGGMSIWNLLWAIFGIVLTDKIGRRPLWLTSFVGMAFANVPLTIASAMYKKSGSTSAAYASVVFMFLYNSAFNIGCNPLPYSYTPEILPYNIRAKGMALLFFVSEGALVVNQYVNPIAMASIGYWYYVFYLGMLFLFIGIIYFTFPETRGYSLEELGALFEDGFEARPKKSLVVLTGEEIEVVESTDKDKDKI
ncbi:hypothetical protein N0V93_010133 [Gnomoniopsis smithogilvyi]|uniref:Major facilitator superfamily (MFS) profile domain-containing protein n=1 Tax=Gnomoniopsis smithogilvyi TaxID=1191159 RepID=A0A9W9CS52_9PEZI|nr:hypothetical protein N0V93_010133 [Gnomoniopsis smithogilvyi]